MFKSILVAGFLGSSLLLAGCDDLNKAVGSKKSEDAPASVSADNPVTGNVADSSEKHKELSAEVAHLILADGSFDAIMDTGIEQGMQVFSANMKAQLGRDLTPEEYAMYEKAFAESFRETFPVEAWEAPLAEIYARHFDSNDLAGLTAFYKTELGKKLLKNQGVLTKESAEMGLKVVEGKQQEFVNLFTKKLGNAVN
ncbi:MAG: DUF2059 domain-containing protein [Methylobacillus sp.]|jgi:hypothetical protein|nr:DUF2059 domain-containing protein [Methylobacillus sp.]